MAGINGPYDQQDTGLNPAFAPAAPAAPKAAYTVPRIASASGIAAAPVERYTAPASPLNPSQNAVDAAHLNNNAPAQQSPHAPVVDAMLAAHHKGLDTIGKFYTGLASDIRNTKAPASAAPVANSQAPTGENPFDRQAAVDANDADIRSQVNDNGFTQAGYANQLRRLASDPHAVQNLANDRDVKYDNAATRNSIADIQRGIAVTNLNTDPNARLNPAYNAEAVRMAARPDGQVGNMDFAPGAPARFAQQAADQRAAQQGGYDSVKEWRQGQARANELNNGAEGKMNDIQANLNLLQSRMPDNRAAEHAAAQSSYDATQAQLAQSAAASAAGRDRDQAAYKSTIASRNVMRAQRGLPPLDGRTPAEQQAAAAQNRDLSPQERVANTRAETVVKEGQRKAEAQAASLGFKGKVAEEVARHNLASEGYRKEALEVKQTLASAANAIRSQADADKVELAYNQQVNNIMSRVNSDNERLIATGRDDHEREKLQEMADRNSGSAQRRILELRNTIGPAVAKWKTAPAGQTASAQAGSLPSGAMQAAPGVADGTVGGGGKFVARGGHWYPKQ